MEKTYQNRLSNFELLRIFAMFLILVSHYAQHGLLPTIVTKTFAIQFFTMYLHTLGAIGVTLFVLLTGYFMIDKKIEIKHFFNIAIETIFYSWCIYGITVNIFKHSNMYYAESTFPILTGQYWFVTAYLILYLMIPLLNKLFYTLDKLSLKRYIFLFIFIWFILPLFSNQIDLKSSSVTDFICIYYIGAYIKKYGFPFFENKFNIMLTVLLSEGIICIYQLLHLIKHIFIENRFMYITWSNSVLTTFTSISIFYLFKNYSLRYSPTINYFSSSALAVYLITENICVRKIIWVDIFHCNLFNNGFYVFLNIIIALFASYMICTIIDKIRMKLLGQWLLQYVENVYNKIFYFITKYI